MGMQANAVIGAIVRQTMVLIAQLSTSSGMRAPLAHIANQTFLSLVAELERQGIAQKVIADMFGLALRSFQQKVQRLNESATDRGVSLWEAMFRYIEQQKVVSRAEVLRRFSADDQASVRGILNDMVDSQLIYKTGRGDGTAYRIAPREDMQRFGDSPDDALVDLTWVTVYGEGPVTLSRLGELLAVDDAALARALSVLTADGRITCDHSTGQERFSSEHCYIPLGESAGWEAVLIDHYQAVVRAMCAKLSLGPSGAALADRTGGSTYSFDVWAGHPKAAEVYALLARTRAEVSALWDAVNAHNRAHANPDDADRVTFYCGQWVAAGQSKHEEAEG